MTDHHNILYVTTRQWNPGDEFIMGGVRAALRGAGWRPRVEAIYNKSPQVATKWGRFNPFRIRAANLSAGYADSFVHTAHFDNSFGPHNDINFFDAVVFCGSPGWFGGRLHGLYEKLGNFRGQVLFLGIGASNRAVKLSKTEVDVLRSASVVTVRDEYLHGELTNRYGVECEWITCPAFLAAPSSVEPDPTSRIGLVYTAAHTNRGHRVSDEHEALQNAIFHRVIETHPDAEVICNYYDEVDAAAQLFGRERVRHAFDALDYPDLMGEYRYVVSSRVHGCGISSSVGVPNLLLGHDRRAATVAGFGSLVTTDVEAVLDAIARFADPIALAEESARLLEMKAGLMAAYVERVKDRAA